MEISVILLSGSIPAAAAVGASAPVLSILSVLIIVAVSIRQLFRWDEAAGRSAAILAALQREAIGWSYKLPPYGDPYNAGGLLAARVEELVAPDASRWPATAHRSLLPGSSTHQLITAAAKEGAA